jgi:predicted transposase/invertase (TIGR01784 family)
MDDDNNFIRFDWAAKRMLRDKANFGVFEGLITVLLNEPVHIIEILESESNQIKGDSTYGCVVLMAINDRNDKIIIELQTIRELHYLWNLVTNGYKPFPEHISLGDKYDNVKKVYSISILYFDLGQGADYLYHGQTSLIGVHTKDKLKINSRDKGIITIKTPEEIFPEYFIVRVNEFNKVAKTPLEEWLDYLKSGHIKKDTTAPGLQEAREKLQYMKMSKAERKAYDRHIDNIMVQNDVLDTAKMEGREEGREEGRKEATRATAKNLKAMGLDVDAISKATGLSKEEIAKL